MSDPVKMLGPGPSALYQTGQAGPVQGPTCFERDSRGSSIHQKTLAGGSIAEFSRDPFNILPEHQLVRRILKLSGKLRLTGQESAADASTRFKESRLLSFTRREPVFHRIIVQALTDNPTAVPAIRRAILQDNPGLLPVNKGITHEACRALAELIRPEIQAIKDSNLIKFFDRLPKNTTSQMVPHIGPCQLSNFSALPLGPPRDRAAAIRKWFDENQSLLLRFSALDLMDADLEIIPRELSRLRDLQFLNLGGNRLSNIPDSFGSLEKLLHLSLDRNQFSKFPEILFQVKSLRVLIFRENRLESIPEPSSLTDLVEIDFAGNRLLELPQKVYDLPRLQNLDLSCNPNFNQDFPSEGRLKDGLCSYGGIHGKRQLGIVKFRLSSPQAAGPQADLTIYIKDTALAKRLYESLPSTTASSSSSPKRKREAEPLG